MQLRQLLSKIILWPYLLIVLVTSTYFLYILSDSRYFFYDDFTAFTFALPRTYTQLVVDSLASGDVDRHKIVGYVALKALYDTIGLQVNYYFLFLFVLHTVNAFLVYKLLLRTTNNRIVSALLATVFAWRFYLWWIANIENILGGLFLLITIHLWFNFVEAKHLLNYFFMWIIAPLMVYTYGPTIFLYPALLLFTPIKKWKYLVPFMVGLVIYVLHYTSIADSLTRFAEVTNPYYRPVSVNTWITTQAIYFSELSKWLSAVKWVPIGVWTTTLLLVLRYRPSWLKYPLAFLIFLFPNSFFPNHTMFYYLYLPIVFILLFFGQLLTTKYWPLWLVVFMAIFNPFANVYEVAFRLRHPSVNFEEQAMIKIAKLTDVALANGDNQVKLSNWEVTPNLHGAITYQALPYWLSSSSKFNHNYSYSQNTQILTITPKNPYP